MIAADTKLPHNDAHSTLMEAAYAWVNELPHGHTAGLKVYALLMPSEISKIIWCAFCAWFAPDSFINIKIYANL